MTRLRLPSIFVLLVALFGGIFWVTQPAYSYIPRPDNPPDGQIAPPLNASDSAQKKAGDLTIGSGSNVLCLNPTAGVGTGDSTNCISSWDQIDSALGGQFVRLNKAAPSSNPNSYGNYDTQAGFARVTSTGDQQNYSAVIAAPHQCVELDPSANEVPCGSQSTQESCFCSGDQQSSCTGSSDCTAPNSGSPGEQSNLYGIYATNGGNANNVAGRFAGNLLISGNTYPYNGYSSGQLCLNGTGGSSCISAWEDLTGSGTIYVRLRKSTAGAPFSYGTASKQYGGVSLTASTVTDSSNGVGSVGSILAGDPYGFSTTPSCGSAPCTCGDGFCASEGNCPIDCATVGQPTLSLYTLENEVKFSITTGSQSPSGTVQLLVTRSTDASDPFEPQNGRLYYTGMTVGGSTIIYAGSVNGGSSVSISGDSNVVSGTTYYYRAYQGNHFPRYSNAATDSIKVVHLNVTKSGPTSAGGVLGNNNSFVCSTSCTSTQVVYEYGITETLDTIVLPSYTFTGWSGACSGQSCSILMNGDKSVTATFSSGGGGGGTLTP